MDSKICIVDYGSGNVASVFNLMSKLSKSVTISNTKSAIEDATHVILPGVGSFANAMTKTRQMIDIPHLENEVLKKGKPFLGICVGMQMLADKGHEFGETKGLGWIRGEVEKLKVGSLVLPHVGWNSVEASGEFSTLTGLDFYFVHSYCFKASDPSQIKGVTDYGESFASIVAHENIWGVQFHPEKSQISGLKILKLFIEKAS